MRTLGVIALAGVGVSVVCLAVAHAIDPTVYRESHTFMFGHGCVSSSADSPTETQDIAWDGEREVVINVPATVHYRPDGGPALRVTAPAGVVQHLRVRNGRITADCNLSRGSHLDLVLPGRAFETFTLNGAGRLLLENIDQNHLGVHVRGFGDVRATGRADDLDLSISGAGNADFGKLTVRTSKVSISGAGRADLDARDSADVSISGAGEIRLIERPRNLQTHIAGAGRIINAPTQGL